MNKLIEYINSRPALNLVELAREAGLPERYVHDYINGHRNMSANMAHKLAGALSKYGLELKGWRITTDDAAVYGEKHNRDLEMIETERGFEYPVVLDRTHWDKSDFHEYINI